jgi:hypothetical protein
MNRAAFYPASPIKPIRTRATKSEMTTRRRVVFEIIREEHPATVRQVYYQADVRKLVEKSDKGYDKYRNC